MSDYPYPLNDGGTHWEGCWRERRHHNCAVLEADRLKLRLRTTAQMLIERVGADGPMNAEDAALRAIAKLNEMEASLAECYRLTGADPDGDPDHWLAPHAVREVKRLREERDETGEENCRLEDALTEVKAENERLRALWREHEANENDCLCALDTGFEARVHAAMKRR